MRLSLALVIVTAGMAAWVVVPIARAQAVASQPAEIHAATPPGAAHPTASATASPARERRAGHISRRSPSRHSPTAHSGAAAGRSAATGRDGGVLALGATDITGNRELPKVMVIVPWKDSLGAGGVVKPTDSLLDEALQPVDRGVFQRQVHYYGQLSAGEASASAAGKVAPGKVAPVGDSR